MNQIGLSPISEQLAKPIDHIEKIFVINLKHRTDRMELFTQDCIRMGIPLEKVERFDAIRTEDGCIGCNLSHQQVLLLARERGYKTFWVMEDDFTFTITPEEMNQSLQYFFDLVKKNSIDWRVIMPTYNHKMIKTQPVLHIEVTNCGCSIPRSDPPSADLHSRCARIDPVVALTYHAQNAASYIVNASNASYLDQLIQCIHNGTIVLSSTGQHWIGQNDQIWKQLQWDEKWYIFKKRFGEQRCTYSDLSKCISKND